MVKINSLELENVKRIKAVAFKPTANGLTVIGGKNGQGKTSVINSIAWDLGGEKYRPTTPDREGSVLPPSLHIELSNGLIVERKGKNSTLKVTDPKGNKSGQQLLNQFIETLALDLPKFMGASNKEKANILLQVIGVGDQLFKLEQEEQSTYNQRRAIGQIADQKKKYASEMTHYPDAPEDLISPSALIRDQQEILARNGENAKKRQRAQYIGQQVETMSRHVEQLRNELTAAEESLNKLSADYETSQKDTLTLHDESTEELEKNIADVEEINRKVRANLSKQHAEEEAEAQCKVYDKLTDTINDLRSKKQMLLNGAKLPLPGLTVDNGELLYNGYRWDGMSGSDQLRVATAIVRAINPECGFVLLDKLEQMDTDTLQEFGAWLEQEGLQAIATRVSTGGECSIIIEDGEVSESIVKPAEKEKKWKAGSF